MSMPSLAIAPQNFPWLSSEISRTPLQWSNGQTYELLLTSMYVRINNLGIQWCVMCTDPVLEMSKAQFLHFLPGYHDQGWQNFPCFPNKTSFCSADNFTLFPNVPVYVPISENALVATTCNSQTANRNIDLSRSSSTKHYDMSLCDLVDRNLEFVFDVHSGLVYWRHNSKQLWWNLCLTVSSLFFFTRVCEHLALLVHGKRRKFSVLNFFSIIGMLLLCRVLLAVGVLSQHLVTQEELTLNLVLEFYCYVYIIAESRFFRNICKDSGENTGEHSGDDSEDDSGENSPNTQDSPNTKKDQDISTLGSLVAVQLILTAHLQNTYENPFIGILTLIFGMRVFLKFMRFMLVHTERHSCDFYFVFGKFCFLCVDTVTLVCIFELGLRVASHSKTEYGSTATGMLIIIVMSGAFLHTVIDQAKNKH